MQLLVLGMHRSGTSPVTRILNLMGASLGADFRDLEANDANPRGFWERDDLVALDDDLLRACGAEWYALAGLEGRLAQLSRGPFVERARALLAKLGVRPWVIKDPRLSVLLPFWLPLLEKPVAVLVYRDPIEVAHSLARRDLLPLDFGLALTFEYLRRSLRDLDGVPIVWVAHDQLLNQPFATAERLLKDLEQVGVSGLSLPERSAIADFIDPRLHRAQRGADLELPTGLEALQSLIEARPRRIRVADLPPEDRDSRWAEHYGTLLQRCGGLPWRSESPTEVLSELQASSTALHHGVAQIDRGLASLNQGMIEVNGSVVDLAEGQKRQLHGIAAGLNAGFAKVDLDIGSISGSLGRLHRGVGEVIIEIEKLENRQIKSRQGLSDRIAQLGAFVVEYDRVIDELLLARRWRLGQALDRLLFLFGGDRRGTAALKRRATLRAELEDLRRQDLLNGLEKKDDDAR